MSKQQVMARVKEALSVPTETGVKSLAGGGERDPRKAQAFMPPGGETYDERKQLFIELAEKLKVEVHCLANKNEAAALLRKLKQECGWKKTASHHSALTDDLVTQCSPSTLWMEDRPGTDALEGCDAGITACEALIAQTGSVLVSSKGSGGRALSVLPPHHVVLATRDQLQPTLLSGYDVLREKYGKDLPSFISFITGASRTGDIERILVLGAHGPKRLTVLLIES